MSRSGAGRIAGATSRTARWGFTRLRCRTHASPAGSSGSGPCGTRSGFRAISRPCIRTSHGYWMKLRLEASASELSPPSRVRPRPAPCACGPGGPGAILSRHPGGDRGARQDAGGGPCQHHSARAGGPMSASIGVYVATALFAGERRRYRGGDEAQTCGGRPDSCVKQCQMWRTPVPNAMRRDRTNLPCEGRPYAGELLGQSRHSRSVHGIRARRQIVERRLLLNGCRAPSRLRSARRSWMKLRL